MGTVRLSLAFLHVLWLCSEKPRVFLSQSWCRLSFLALNYTKPPLRINPTHRFQLCTSVAIGAVMKLSAALSDGWAVTSPLPRPSSPTCGIRKGAHDVRVLRPPPLSAGRQLFTGRCMVDHRGGVAIREPFLRPFAPPKPVVSAAPPHCF